MVLRTVYGKVPVKSPRLWSCACQRTARTPLHSIVAHPVYRSAFWPAPSVATYVGVGPRLRKFSFPAPELR
jgi:hypothetical protein